MRLILLIFFLFLMTNHSYSQLDLHHQALSTQGVSKVLSNGMYVSQTIGQQSVIGNFTHDKKTYAQGFQQKVWDRYIKSNSNSTHLITTITYPNPFVRIVNFKFSEPITSAINVQIFDVKGSLVFQKEQLMLDSVITLDLDNLASSNYLVRLTSNNFTYYTKILKTE